MENKNMNDKIQIYSNNLKQMFDKIKKHIAKKHVHYNDLTNNLKDINEKINNDKEINVDKYFQFIKMSLETDNVKLIESILEHMHKLIKEDIFLGQTEDTSVEKKNIRFNYFFIKKRLIDSFVESIIKFYKIADENILIQSVTTLFSICKSGNTNIHNETIIQIFIFCIRVYLVSRTTINIETTKITLNSIILHYFNKMEYFNNMISLRESSSKISILEGNSVAGNITEFEKTDFSTIVQPSFGTHLSVNNKNSNLGNFLSRGSYNINANSDIASNYTRSNNSINSNLTITNYNMHNYNNLSGFKSNCFVYKNPVDNMIQKILTSVIDDICFINDKENHLISLNEEVNKYGNEEVKENFSELFNLISSNQLNEIEKKIILSSAPKTIEYIKNYPEFFQHLNLCNPHTKNEKGFSSGNYGWCYICRNTADFYCRNTRFPVCSLDCKLKIFQEDEEIFNYISGENLGEDDIALLYLNDSHNIFKSLCKLVNTPIDSNEFNNTKAKFISLELILNLFEKPGNIFITNKEFVNIIQVDLMEGLLRTCMSDDLSIYSSSIKIFFKIWSYFREHLKHQISVFIETIFLKILDSGNSTFTHKWLLLENLYKLAGNAKFFVELYVNYDCDIEEKDLLNRMVNSLSKISQGKYAKLEHQLTPQQEYQLRSRSLEIICMMIRSVLMFAQDQLGSTQKPGINYDVGLDIETPNLADDGYNFDDQISFIDTNTEVSTKEKLDYNRRVKADISTAIGKFNIKVKNGLSYLKKAGMINKVDKDLEAYDIANFLKNSYGLKKEHVGEFLGEFHEVALKTLDYYTQTFDFKDLHIIEAIRTFLSGFQLPGEGQKIDRIMEKFAAKYYKDNPEKFQTADCAYYLAFSIIMLQTDTHNPQVKKKMGVDGFQKMIKGINGGKDLEYEFINDIYLQISQKPISLIEYEEAKDKLDGGVKKKHELFKKETERMFQEGTERLKKKQIKVYLKICEIDHIGLMLESIWTALLAMFSLIMEDSDDNAMNSLCVEGISNSIKLCGMLNLDLQKEALTRAFCKLTNIIQGKEIKEKHINYIRNILHLANFDACRLKGSWKIVLELISKIEYYHNVIGGSKSELEAFFNDVRQKKKLQNIPNIEKEILIEKNNLEKIGKEINPDDYEIIFNKTQSIDDQSLIDFVKSLCEISKDELANKDSPRIFSLQKLVEVAELNIKRVRIVWSQIWNIISDHLVQVGSLPSPNIAEKAIDSLRQIAKKLLLRDEISVYQFQMEFLKPFENILINNINSYRTKEYVITCITNLVLAEASSIKSGWKIIFNIFSLASNDTQADISKKTFDTILKVFNNHFSQIKDNFNELAHCVKKFADRFPEECLNIYNKSFPLLDDIGHVYNLLQCLCTFLRDSRENIRNVSCTSFFTIIRKIAEKTINDSDKSPFNISEKISASQSFNQSSTKANNNTSLPLSLSLRATIKTDNLGIPISKLKYDSDFWKRLFENILKPIIDDLISLKLCNTLEIFLINLDEIFKNSYNNIEFLMEKYLSILVNIICNDNESTALAGFEALRILIENLSNNNVNEKFWNNIINTICVIFKNTRQVDLLNLNIDNFNDQEYQGIYQDIVYKNVIFCIIQHNLIELCDHFIDNHYDTINFNQLNIIMECLRESYELAYNFNIEFNLRQLISYHFMSDLNNTAALFKQQQDGTFIFYKALNKIYDSKTSSNEIKDIARNKIISNSKKILLQFIDRINYNEENSYLFNENERLINNMVPVILESIIKSLEKVHFLREEAEKNDFTEILIEMISCNVLEIRLKIKELITNIFKNSKK